MKKKPTAKRLKAIFGTPIKKEPSSGSLHYSVPHHRSVTLEDLVISAARSGASLSISWIPRPKPQPEKTKTKKRKR